MSSAEHVIRPVTPSKAPLAMATLTVAPRIRRALSVDPGHARFNAILYANRASAWGHRDRLQQARM